MEKNLKKAFSFVLVFVFIFISLVLPGKLSKAADTTSTTDASNIGVLFADNSGAQTADCKDLEPGKTYWLTNGSENLLNDSGMGGGVNVVASTEPKAGWPEGPAADTATTTPATTSDDKDGYQVFQFVVIAVAIVAVVIITGAVITKKTKGNK